MHENFSEYVSKHLMKNDLMIFFAFSLMASSYDSIKAGGLTFSCIDPDTVLSNKKLDDILKVDPFELKDDIYYGKFNASHDGLSVRLVRGLIHGQGL